MGDVFLPPWVRRSAAQWTAVANTAVSRSIFTGATQTLGRTGDRLRASITIAGTSDRTTDAERSIVKSLLLALRGQANRLYFFDPSYACRGSFPDGELLANPSFGSGTAGWSVYNDATIAVRDRILRAKRSASGASSGASASASVTSGAAYCMRAFVSTVLNSGGSQSLELQAVASSTFTGTSSAGAGYRSLAFVAAASSATARILDSATAGVNVGDYFDVPWISLTRCALINGAGQTGAQLKLKNLPASSSGLLLPGDVVQWGTELNVVIAPLDSDSSGFGYVTLYRPFRGAPADADAVVITNPLGRFVATGNELSWNDTPGIFTDYALEIEEALDA